MRSNKAAKKATVIAILALLCMQMAFASTTKFSGGYTRISLADGNRTVQLTKDAKVSTEDFKLEADSIRLYGENYSFVECKGNVKVVQEAKKLTLKTTSLLYDRSTETLKADGWTEIDDLENEAKISCARLEYNTETEVMKLEILAKIETTTSRGVMKCGADTITFDNAKRTLVLKGSALVEWDGDTYSASIISINLDTEEVTMTGSVNGEING